VAKITHDSEFSTEFEITYLMLAIDYIERGKVDLAHDLVQRCLFHNRSSSKAWEILGKTLELKNGNQSAIVECHEKCWAGNKQSCAAGFQLATLYLKLKRPADALEVASQVLAIADNVHLRGLISECVSSFRP